MKMKTTLTCMICCILILEATGRIERPRGVALSSKYATLALVDVRRCKKSCVTVAGIIPIIVLSLSLISGAV